MNWTAGRVAAGLRPRGRGGGVRAGRTPVPAAAAAATAAGTGRPREFHATPRRGTTIVCVRKGGQVCMMADGMVSQGSMIVKPNVVKIRRILPKSGTDAEKAAGATVVGFAGSTADAFTLLERLEGKLDEYPGQLARSCVELAKGWRTDKYLRRLEASLIVADAAVSLELSGNGDVLESHDGVLSVGSGSPYAKAAARALLETDKSAEEIARRAMEIAAEMCVYTNDNFRVETLECKQEETASS